MKPSLFKFQEEEAVEEAVQEEVQEVKVKEKIEEVKEDVAALEEALEEEEINLVKTFYRVISVISFALY